MTKAEKAALKKKLGKHIQKIRLNKKMSLMDVAAGCSIDDSRISKIEHGFYDVSVSTLVELAKGLEVQPSELLSFL